MAHVSSSSISAQEYREALGQFCTGVTIITTVSEGKPAGLALQAFAALSIDPPLIVACFSKQSRTWVAIEKAGKFAVSVLGAHQEDICKLFGSKKEDKFAELDTQLSPLGNPIIPESLAAIDCTTETVHDGGDHYIAIGRVESVSHINNERPLLFYRGSFLSIEHPQLEPAPQDPNIIT